MLRFAWRTSAPGDPQPLPAPDSLQHGLLTSVHNSVLRPLQKLQQGRSAFVPSDFALSSVLSVSASAKKRIQARLMQNDRCTMTDLTASRLNRRQALTLILWAACGSASAARVPASQFSVRDYNRAVVIDAQSGFGDIDQSSRLRSVISDVSASGLTAISITVGEVGNGPRRLESAVSDIARLNGLLAAFPDALTPVQRANDLRRAKEHGQTGIIFNVQDTAALEGESSRVRLLEQLGIRIIQLTYNKRNLCGDGCLEPENAGLSDFGREVVHEINSCRVLLDLSHGGARTISEAVKHTAAPPAVTHTGCRDLVDNQRNLYDSQMREIADKGGVVGIYLIAYLRSGIGQRALNARREDLIAHLEHAIDVCGEEHVGIGTDGEVSALVITPEALAYQKKRFEERTREGLASAGEGPDVFNYVAEYNTPRRFYALATDLASRGWPARRIERVIGGNFARLFTDVWGS